MASASVSAAVKGVRGFFGGSGLGMLNDARTIARVLAMLEGKKAADVTVLYIGTATYDMVADREHQTVRFLEAGCKVTDLSVTAGVPKDMQDTVAAADVIIISGGNTVFAIDRWYTIGLDVLLRQAKDRGAILAGGSAGAICWFDAGHSDSMDPESFKAAYCAAKAAEAAGEPTPAKSAGHDSWRYIRCRGLGFLPGFICPHHDKIQSNGKLRATDFDGMLGRHPGEHGICIDHFAALVVDDGAFEVFSLADEAGSVLADGTFSEGRKGKPGIWVKDLVDGTVVSALLPEQGQLTDVLKPATAMTEDPHVATCRQGNPDDAPSK